MMYVMELVMLPLQLVILNTQSQNIFLYLHQRLSALHYFNQNFIVMHLVLFFWPLVTPIVRIATKR